MVPRPRVTKQIMECVSPSTLLPCGYLWGHPESLFTNKIKERERDPLRFHWRLSKGCDIDTYRFRRALFGLTCSPFLLGGVIEQHLHAWENKMPETVLAVGNSLYVDDLLNEGHTVDQA